MVADHRRSDITPRQAACQRCFVAWLSLTEQLCEVAAGRQMHSPHVLAAWLWLGMHRELCVAIGQGVGVAEF